MNDMFSLVEEAIERWEEEGGLNLLLGDRERLTAHVVLATSGAVGALVDHLEEQFQVLREQIDAQGAHA